ncbi:ComF family protein [Thermoflavimicrobium dichotomicum]|uniref:ComF family protein n=1 Tax=Thermoflavimicrobium dichotomicum TaxID=46223 RepID=UPI000B8798A2|nr:ComF family protein [Thermoflavimicrobium dichotomicum]
MTLFPLPKPCCFCTTPVRSFAFSSVWKQMCLSCQEQFFPINGPVCQVCGRPMTEEDLSVCIDCRQLDSSTWVTNRSVVLYKGQAKKVIQWFKYQGLERLAIPLGLWMAESCYHYYRRVPLSLITFVPLHPNRLHERGFNQAELLAQVISQRLGLPVKEILVRERETFSQSHRSRKERLQALQHVFKVSNRIDPGWLRQQHILIVDDVYTTGSTLRECARPLRQANVRQIFSVTFAR